MYSYFTSLFRSDRWYLLVLYRSWAVIPCHWSVIMLIVACILQVLRNHPMPLISQIVDICLHITSLEQLSDAIYRSDLLVFYKSWAIIQCHWLQLIGQIIDKWLCFTCLEQLFNAIDRSDRWSLIVFCRSWALLFDVIDRSDPWYLLVFYKS